MNIIYIDVLLIENVLINFLILYVVYRFCRVKRNLSYLFLSSLIGALYVFIVFFPALSMFYSALMKFCVSILMIIIAFWPRTFRAFLKMLLIFYGVAFFLGGAIISIFYLVNDKMVSSVNGVMLLNKISSKYLIYGVIVSIFVVKILFDVVDRYFDIKNRTVQITVINNEKSIKLTALLDTGNCLKDPISGHPIIIVDIKYIADILPNEVIDLVMNNRDIGDIKDFEISKRIRIIPYMTIGVENGLLIGYRVDYVYIISKNKVGVIKDPILALSRRNLSTKDDYQAIAYPEIISWEV